MSASELIGPEWILQVAVTKTSERELLLLLECSRRLWPGLRVFARRVMDADVSADERDRLSTEVWEEVLAIAVKTLREPKSHILNLEAYLSISFRNLFLRRANQEKKLRERIQFLPPDDLLNLKILEYNIPRSILMTDSK